MSADVRTETTELGAEATHEVLTAHADCRATSDVSETRWSCGVITSTEAFPIFARMQRDHLAVALAAHTRAAVEQERAAWAARIEALAVTLDGWAQEHHQFAVDLGYPDDDKGDTDAGLADAFNHSLAQVRTLLTSDSTAVLDAVKAEAGRAALREAANAWTAGSPGGRLVDPWLRARADQIGGAL